MLTENSAAPQAWLLHSYYQRMRHVADQVCARRTAILSLRRWHQWAAQHALDSANGDELCRQLAAAQSAPQLSVWHAAAHAGRHHRTRLATVVLAGWRVAAVVQKAQRERLAHVVELLGGRQLERSFLAWRWLVQVG